MKKVIAIMLLIYVLVACKGQDTASFQVTNSEILQKLSTPNFPKDSLMFYSNVLEEMLNKDSVNEFTLNNLVVVNSALKDLERTRTYGEKLYSLSQDPGIGMMLLRLAKYSENKESLDKVRALMLDNYQNSDFSTFRKEQIVIYLVFAVEVGLEKSEVSENTNLYIEVNKDDQHIIEALQNYPDIGINFNCSFEK